MVGDLSSLRIYLSVSDGGEARVAGTVKWFDGKMGFGVSKDMFVHRSLIRYENFSGIREDKRFEFFIGAGDDSRTKAVDVTGPHGVAVNISQFHYDFFYLRLSSSDLIWGTFNSESIHRISKVHDQYSQLNDISIGNCEIEELVEKIVSGLFCSLATLAVIWYIWFSVFTICGFLEDNVLLLLMRLESSAISRFASCLHQFDADLILFPPFVDVIEAFVLLLLMRLESSAISRFASCLHQFDADLILFPPFVDVIEAFVLLLLMRLESSAISHVASCLQLYWLLVVVYYAFFLCFCFEVLSRGCSDPDLCMCCSIRVVSMEVDDLAGFVIKDSGVSIDLVMASMRYRLYGMYEKLGKEAQAQMNKELSGLKLVVNAPTNPSLLCVMVGDEVQILGMAVVTILFAALGFMSQASCGTLLTCIIFCYVTLGIAAGYVVVRGAFGCCDKGWVSVSWRAACFFPIAGGEFHCCAITVSDELYTLVDGTYKVGFLGHGTDFSHWISRRICGHLDHLQVSFLTCGPRHTSLVQLFVFGDGFFGFLGHGDWRSVSYIREIESFSGLKMIYVAIGVWHTAAIVEVPRSKSSATMFFRKAQKSRAYFKRFQVKFKQRKGGKTDYRTSVTASFTAYCIGLLLACHVLKMLELDDKYEGNVEETGEDYSVDPPYTRRPLRALLDVGLLRTTTRNRVDGALKGALDGVLDIPHSEKRFAGFSKDSMQLDDDFHHKYVYGGYVTAYMRTLAEDEPKKVHTQFSENIKRGIDALCAMFDGGYHKKDGKDIETPNIIWEFFDLMMRYIYPGFVDVHLGIAQELLHASYQYLLQGLQNLCEYAIAHDVFVNNGTLMFKLSEAFTEKSLPKACLLFILEHFDELSPMSWSRYDNMEFHFQQLPDSTPSMESGQCHFPFYTLSLNVFLSMSCFIGVLS